MCFRLLSVLGFWDRAALGGATLEGIRGSGSDNASGVGEEVGNGHAVQVAVRRDGLDFDESKAEIFGRGCCDLFGVPGHGGVGFVGGGVEFNNGIAIVECKITDGVGVNRASNVLSHGGVSFAFV